MSMALCAVVCAELPAHVVGHDSAYAAETGYAALDADNVGTGENSSFQSAKGMFDENIRRGERTIQEQASVEWDLSRVAIVGPAEKRGSNEIAVEELKYHLSAIADSQCDNGAQFRFVFEKPDDGKMAEPFESRYRIDGKTVYFWGDDDGPAMDWKPGERRSEEQKIHHGSLFAVELFLEKELGVRWIWPGEDGMVFTKRKKVSFPAKKESSFVSTLALANFRPGGAVSKRSVPSYEEVSKFVPGLSPEILSGDSYRADERYHERVLWRLRMRLQNCDNSIKYGHAFTDWKSRFGKTHPEYLALVHGERGNVNGAKDSFVHLCVSNEGAINQIIADWLAGGTNRYLNVCENDGTAYCECPECTKFDVNLPTDGKVLHRSDRYVQFWNRIAEKAMAIRPDVVLVGYLYNEYRLPPRKQRLSHGDHMLLGVVPSLMDDTTALFKGWSAMGAKNYFLRPNHHHYLGSIPRGLERYLYQNFREAIECGAIGFDYDAPANRLAMDIEYYVTGKMLQNPNMDFDQVCEEFYSGYGAAKAEVKEYFEAVRRDGETARYTFLANGEKLDKSQISMPGPRALQAYGRNEAELNEKVALLERALEKHPELDEAARKRLETLLLVAKHAVVTFRFCSAAEHYQTDMQTFWDRSQELLEFRKRHWRDLPDCYSVLFRKWWGEVQQWKFLRRPAGIDCK